MQKVFFRTLKEIASECRTSFSEDNYFQMLNFVEQKASLINVENCTAAVESVCWICTVVEDSKMAEVVHKTVRVAIEHLPNLTFDTEE
jgi:hypothetical protein